jgi:hypothetical protein
MAGTQTRWIFPTISSSNPAVDNFNTSFLMNRSRASLRGTTSSTNKFLSSARSSTRPLTTTISWATNTRAISGRKGFGKHHALQFSVQIFQLEPAHGVAGFGDGFFGVDDHARHPHSARFRQSAQGVGRVTGQLFAKRAKG